MKQDPSRGGGSTLSPAYSAALQQLVDKRTAKKPSTWDNVLGGLKDAAGLAISPLATAADIVGKPFELIPGVPDVNPESVGSVNLFVQGGKSLQHVYGDAKELARSIITGKDTLSQSPTAQVYQAAGGGLTGTLAAAGPYLDLGSVVAPMAMGAARGAGLVAPKPVPYTPLTAADIAESQARSARIVPDTTPTPMTRDDLLSYVRRARTMGTTRAKMPDEFDVASDYFGPNFPQYQNALREGMVDDVMAANIAKARTLFENSYPLDRPTILYRGIKNPNYLPRKQYANFVKNLKVGDVIEEPGFMSTTIDKDMAEGFANGGFVFEIDAPRGTSVVSPLMNDELMRPYADPERELLMAPNTKLEITGIEGNTIRARVVPSDTPASVYRTTRNALAEDMAQTTPEVTAPQAGRTMKPVEELAAAQARAETAPVVRDTAAEGTRQNDPYVFNVGGERIVFGPPELDISSVKAGPNGVRVVPIDPYELSNLKIGTEAGDKIADDFTIAMGVDKEMAPALLYAGSRGNKSAMAQFEQLVEAGRAKMKQRRATVNSQPEIPDEVWASTVPEVMVDTGRTVRPANIDDLFLVHETAYAPPKNQAGDVVLSPSSEFGPYGRDSVHFALNHVVSPNEGRTFSGDNRYIVIVPLRDALDANPGSLDNLLWGDTFLTPKPGRGLTLPGRSVKVLTNPDGDQIWETLSQVAAAHNKSSGYKVLTAEEVGGHTSHGLSERIRYLADRVIPSEYDEYVSAIGSARHGAHPMWNKQASFESVSIVPPVFVELLSPNSRMQYFRGLKKYLGHDVGVKEQQWS